MGIFNRFGSTETNAVLPTIIEEDEEQVKDDSIVSLHHQAVAEIGYNSKLPEDNSSISEEYRWICTPLTTAEIESHKLVTEQLEVSAKRFVYDSLVPQRIAFDKAAVEYLNAIANLNCPGCIGRYKFFRNKFGKHECYQVMGSYKSSPKYYLGEHLRSLRW